MGISRSFFGKAEDGAAIDIYTLTNRNGLEARIMTLGGTLVGLRAPDRSGKLGDVVLGFDSLAPYLAGHPFFGSLVGRYGNRIDGGIFELEGQRYELELNDGPNHLHGGSAGFDKVIWQAEPQLAGGASVVLSHTSPAGAGNYPGNLAVTVTYTLTDDNGLQIDYRASTDRPTVLNLTNHAYFNLAGAGTILDHLVEIAADRFLPVNANLIPSGERRPVRGTPMDFCVPTRVGAHIFDDDEQLRLANGGYDHTWVLSERSRPLALAARVLEETSGREMTVLTTQPGVQFYTGNFLDGSLQGKNGQVYSKHTGLCLETQHFPNSPNQPDFPSTLLRPGEIYQQTTVYRFATR